MAMISNLPENLLALFAPRPPLDYIPIPERNKHNPYSGISEFTNLFENPDEAKNDINDADKVYVETRERKKKRIAKLRKEKQTKTIEEQLKEWNPKQTHSSDPFHTLFVARLNYITTEETLKKEFGYYGIIKSINLIRDKDGKSRGYAFIEYERERDMKNAYKQADGIRIDSKRVLVDMERARTVSSFRPRRLGGGLGNTRKDKLPKILRPRISDPYSRPYDPPRPVYRGGGRDYGYERDRRGSYRGPPRRDYRDSGPPPRDRRDYRDSGPPPRDRRDNYSRDRRDYHDSGPPRRDRGYSDRRRDYRY